MYRLFQYWKKEKDAASKQVLCFIGLFGLFVLLTLNAGLFFSENSCVLVKRSQIGAFIQAFAFAVMAYHIVYLKFPKISPWLGFFPVLGLGLAVAILNMTFLQISPFLEPSGAINWGVPFDSSLAVFISLLRFFLFLITFVPLVVILFSQFKKSTDYYLKGKSLGLGLTLLLVLVGASFDFLFISVFRLDAVWRDIAFIVCSLILLVTLTFTLPRPSSKI